MDIIEQFHLGLIILDIEKNNTQYKYCLKETLFKNVFFQTLWEFFCKKKLNEAFLRVL